LKKFPSPKISTFGRKLSQGPRNTRKHRYLPILDYPQLTKPNGIGFEKFSFHDTFHRVAKPSPWLRSQRENFFFTFGRKLSLAPRNTRKHRYLPILDYPQLTKPNGIGFEKFSFHDTFHRVAKPSPWLRSQREIFFFTFGRKLSLDPRNTRKHRYLPILDYPQLTKPNGIGFEKFSFHDTFHRVAKPSPWLHSQRENFCLHTVSAGKT
jgi:hypothetical protein